MFLKELKPFYQLFILAINYVFLLLMLKWVVQTFTGIGSQTIDVVYYGLFGLGVWAFVIGLFVTEVRMLLQLFKHKETKMSLDMLLWFVAMTILFLLMTYFSLKSNDLSLLVELVRNKIFG